LELLDFLNDFARFVLVVLESRRGHPLLQGRQALPLGIDVKGTSVVRQDGRAPAAGAESDRSAPLSTASSKSFMSPTTRAVLPGGERLAQHSPGAFVGEVSGAVSSRNRSTPLPVRFRGWTRRLVHAVRLHNPDPGCRYIGSTLRVERRTVALLKR